MITTNQQNRILETIVGSLELPLSAYETAKSRYEDLGTYLAREGSSCELNDPLVYSQGSFRLGTAIRPLDSDEDYDLDLASCLRSGVSTKTHTQEDLKTAIGRELQSYELLAESKRRLKKSTVVGDWNMKMGLVFIWTLCRVFQQVTPLKNC